MSIFKTWRSVSFHGVGDGWFGGLTYNIHMDNELFLVTQLWLEDKSSSSTPESHKQPRNVIRFGMADNDYDMRCDLQKSFEFENSTFEGSFCGVALSKLSFSFWPPQCLHQLRASQWNDQLYIRGMLCISKVYGHSWAQGANPISGPHKFDPYLKRMAIFLQ